MRKITKTLLISILYNDKMKLPKRFGTGLTKETINLRKPLMKKGLPDCREIREVQ